jgi:hypothetical protein
MIHLSETGGLPPSCHPRRHRRRPTMDNTARTLPDAVSELRYALRFGELNERLWRRLETTLNLFSALGGSAAVGAVAGQSDVLTLAAGLVMAITGALQLVLRPGERAAAFRTTRRDLLGLESKAWSLSVTDLDATMHRIEADAPDGFAALAQPAWNDCVRRLGQASLAQPLTFGERFLSRLA